MATTKTTSKTGTKKTTTAKKNTTKPASVDNENINEPSSSVVSKSKKKEFSPNDIIECRSVTSGELMITGDKTDSLYIFADFGFIEGISYQDLSYAVRARKRFIYKPRIIVLDEDFIEQHKDLKEFYDSMYTTSDFQSILLKPAEEIKHIIAQMPEGAVSTIKSLAAAMIESGELDSVRTIKALDDIFGTQLVLALSDN